MFKEWCAPHLKSPSKCLLALLMHECSRREMFAYKAWNVNDEKNNAGNKQQQFPEQCLVSRFITFPIVTTGWFSPVWVWGWQAVRGHWHWAPRRCPGFPAKFNLIGNRKCKRIVKKYPKIPALWKQSPGFWGTPWSLWPLLQDPYHTWWWGWWWWDWWTSLVVLFVQ